MQPGLSPNNGLLANTPDANQSSAHDRHHVTQGRHIYITLFHVCTIQMRMHGQYHWDESHILVGARCRTEDLYMFEETFCCTTCGGVESTVVEPCMPTPKSRSTELTPMSTLYPCPHWGPELSIKSESRSSTIAIQMTKGCRKTCQFLQAKFSSNGAQLLALTGPSWEAMDHEASCLFYCHPSFLFQ